MSYEYEGSLTMVGYVIDYSLYQYQHKVKGYNMWYILYIMYYNTYQYDMSIYCDFSCCTVHHSQKCPELLLIFVFVPSVLSKSPQNKKSVSHIFLHAPSLVSIYIVC